VSDIRNLRTISIVSYSNSSTRMVYRGSTPRAVKLLKKDVYMIVYRGHDHNPNTSQQFAIYYTCNQLTASKYGKTVYKFDTGISNIISVLEFGKRLVQYEQYEELGKYILNNLTTINIDIDGFFESDSECYTIADLLDIDGIIDAYGHLEVYYAYDFKQIGIVENLCR